jgi:hypothetical protein
MVVFEQETTITKDYTPEAYQKEQLADKATPSGDTLTKEDSVTSTASSDNQYTEIMFVVKEAMKAKAKDGVQPTKMIGVKDVIVGKEILPAYEV